MVKRTFIVLMVLVACGVSAQSLQMGNENANPNGGVGGVTVHTAVDLTHPANATGVLEKVLFSWSSDPCPAAVKIKVFRRIGETFTLVGQQGPFTAYGWNNVTLSPAIPVQQGDYLGITRVAACGSAKAESPGWDASYLSVSGDVSTFQLANASQVVQRLDLNGSGTATELIAAVIPAVASNQGSGGANYKTLVQALARPFLSAPLTGRFVFRKKGVPGGPTDPSMLFSIDPGHVESWADLLLEMKQSGFPGSIDVIVPWATQVPIITAHVFNDQGAAGTTGFRQDAIDMIKRGPYFFFGGATGYVHGPADATRYRANVGVRSFEGGVEGTIQVYSAAGINLGSKGFHYPPFTYDQQSWAVMTGVALQDGAYLRITVSRGIGLFYLSVADQVTSDPANTIVEVSEAVL